MNTMTKLISAILISTTFSINAQEYLSLRQDGAIYDVDVIIFARNLAQPNAEMIKNSTSLKTENTMKLMPWDGQTALMKYSQPSQPAKSQGDEWQVPIKEQAPPVQVLSWVILSNSMNHPIINRLNANPTFKTIYRQKWRQPASAFTNPKYVEVSNLSTESDNQYSGDFSNSNSDNYAKVNLYNDFSVDGQVAFSRQKFNHLHVKMNLYRQSPDGKQISYGMTQQKRIKVGQWQYFDHQQFGVLARVTAVSLRPNNE